MKILIKVTKEILERSKMCAGDVGYNCAIANAVKEIFPSAWTERRRIVVNPTEDILVWESIPIPQVATDFICEFDARSPERRAEMQPISFEIDVPNEVIEKIGIQEVYKILSESKTLELVMPA